MYFYKNFNRYHDTYLHMSHRADDLPILQNR